MSVWLIFCSTFKRNNLQQLHRRAFVHKDLCRSAIERRLAIHFEMLSQDWTWFDLPQRDQLDLAEQVVVNQYAAKWRLLAFNFLLCLFRQVGEPDPHHSELYDCTIRLAT